MNENKDFKELDERDKARSLAINTLSLFIGLSALILFHALYSMYDFATDDSVPLVVCPRSFELDAPVLMEKIGEETLTQDRWLRGFVRRFVTYQFPRTEDDAPKFYEYVKNHSVGAVHQKYLAYVKDIDSIKALIGDGYFYKFHPKNSQDIAIRKPNEDMEWIVEIDGWIVARYGMEIERFAKTLRYRIKFGKPTITIPEGLYVAESSVDEILDYVSGRTKGDDENE